MQVLSPKKTPSDEKAFGGRKAVFCFVIFYSKVANNSSLLLEER